MNDPYQLATIALLVWPPFALKRIVTVNRATSETLVVS